MYVQLTTRCNMRCKHCGFSCTSKGEDMSRETWTKVLNYAFDVEEMISLGGGEPTLHPDFEVILIEAIAYAANLSLSDYAPFIATNGTNKRISMLLNALSRAGVVRAKLSWDKWHNKKRVDPCVVRAFSGSDDLWINTNSVSDSGRAKKLPEYKKRKKFCLCPDLFVKPNGDVYWCGCEDAPKLGYISTFFNSDTWQQYVENDNYHSCWKGW